MYEDMIIDKVQENLLSNVSDTYEKTVGYPTYDILKSVAIEVNKLYSSLSNLYNMIDVDNLTGDNLTKYVYQRKGISRKTATYAKGTLTITGTGIISIGDIFETASGTQFTATETVTITSTGIVNIQAIVAGIAGIVGANTITQMPITLQGIISCTNTVVTYDGFEAESDDSLRERYYEALKASVTSGNKSQYVAWAKSVSGVGNAKCISLWNGNNTVKIVIINSDKQPASTDLINIVQNYIDPQGSNNATWGTGAGQAPIGAYCTVTSATAKNIDVSVDVTQMDGYTLDGVTDTIKTNITNYLKEIAFQQDFVSYAKIGSIILNTNGVKDYTTLTINNGISNVNIANEEIAILGVVSVV